MGSCFRGKRKSNFIWWAPISALFVFCSLLTYYTIIYRDFTCFLQFGCLTVEEPRTESLQAEKCEKICITKECITISNRILSNMDPSTEPCNDFYQFVCGKYREKYDGAGNYSTIGSMLEDLYSTIKVVIDKSEWPEGSAMNKVKTVFDSCMNPGTSDVRSVQDILHFLDLTGIPDWPRLDENFAFLKTPLYEILGKLISYEQYVFFKFYGLSDDEFASTRLKKLTFSPAKLKKISEKIISDTGKNMLMTVLLHLGLDTESSEQMSNTFISIEKERQDIIRLASGGKCTEEKIVLNCIDNNVPNLNMLCNITESVVRNGLVETLYDKDRLDMTLCEYHYAEWLQNILEKYSDRDIANYIALIVIFHNVKDLDFTLTMKLQSFYEPEIDRVDFSMNMDKRKKCIYWLTRNMLYPLCTMYIDNYLPNAAAEQVDDLIRKITNLTAELLLEQPWLGHLKYKLAKDVSDLRNSFKYKYENMQNVTEINAMFEMFKPTMSSFINNSLLIKKNSFTQFLTNKERTGLLLKDRMFEVDAEGGIDISVKFGILTPPLFHHYYPKLYNYAGLGFIIGHEIGHFFYIQIQRQLMIKTSQIMDTLLEKVFCLADQYSSFKLRKIEKNVDGKKTSSENVPDSVSMKILELVSKNYIDNVMKEEIILPGLSYSPEQLLYIALAQTYCDVHDAEKENYYASRFESHSPPEYRVIGTLQNSQKFPEVFHCSNTSYMNAEKKCLVLE